jgi:signal transduction histidine kinase
VLEVANLLERQVVDLETAQRGFVITNQERFLQPWRRAQVAFPEEAATLGRLVGNDPAQQEQTRRIDRFLVAERGLAAARERRSDAAAERAIVAAGIGLGGSILLVLLFAGYLTRAIVQPVRRAAAMAGSLEQSREELAASRARIVAASDQARRRIERDLHDGTQQRLVSLVLDLRAAEAA